MKILITKGDGLKGKTADAELVWEDLPGCRAEMWEFELTGIGYLWPKDWARAWEENDG